VDLCWLSPKEQRGCYLEVLLVKKDNWVIHKFGGSCLIDQYSFENIKNILAQKNEIIVVSAITGITTRLQNILESLKQVMIIRRIFNQFKRSIAI
jgi:aspartokinase